MTIRYDDKLHCEWLDVISFELVHWILFNSVRQVHREFLRAGADIIQAFTFSMDDEIIDEKVFVAQHKKSPNFAS